LGKKEAAQVPKNEGRSQKRQESAYFFLAAFFVVFFLAVVFFAAFFLAAIFFSPV
jgi:ABC-type transporter Mla subunit MlaD